MTRLKYLDPADGQYKLLPVGGGGGGAEEVVISAGVAPALSEELWVDTSAAVPVYDWSYADNRYLNSGFRNVVRNGDMCINQRGLGPFAANSYTSDGWYTSSSGGSSSVNVVAASAGEASPRIAAVVSGQSAAGDYAQLTTYMENVNTLNGKIVTLSFDAWSNSGTPKIAVELQQLFGSGGTPSATQNTSVGAVTISTTRTRYSITTTVPSVAGASLGTSGTHALRLILWLSAGSTYASRTSSIGIQSGTFNITDVQLEEGAAATDFERLPIQQQLDWCQRYFQRINCPGANDSPGSAGVLYTATSYHGPLVFPGGVMRADPTITSAGTWEVLTGGTGLAATSAPAFAEWTNRTAIMSFSVSAGGTAGYAAIVRAGSAGANYIDISAEL